MIDYLSLYLEYFKQFKGQEMIVSLGIKIQDLQTLASSSEAATYGSDRDITDEASGIKREIVEFLTQNYPLTVMCIHTSITN